MNMDIHKKIAIVTTGHPGKDDRLYYKFAKTFSQNSITTGIITTIEDIDFNEEALSVHGNSGAGKGYISKSKYIMQQLRSFSPDIIICSEIFAILPAFLHKAFCNSACSIIYDITEWYPENIAFKQSYFKGRCTYIFLYTMMIVFSFFIDGYIAGEKRKLNRFLILSPGKPNEIVSYFPPLAYYPHSDYESPVNGINICFSGLLTAERGFFRFLDVLKSIALRNPGKHITGTIIGKFVLSTDEQNFEIYMKNLPVNLAISFQGWQKYEDLPIALRKVDICIDLREDSYIFTNSLPIKIFEYMACGKPVIYSKNNAIADVFEISEIGFFVSPADSAGIAEIIEMYIDDPALIELHGKQARRLVEQKFNWSVEEKKLLNFLLRF